MSAKRALHLLPWALGARALGFATSILLARWYGIGAAADAWAWAMAVPTVAVVVGSNALSTVLTPRLAATPGSPRRLVAIVAALSILLGIGVALTVPVGIGWTAFDPQRASLGKTYAWCLVPFISLEGVAAVLRSGLEARAKLVHGVAGPGLKALVQVVTTGACLEHWGPIALPIGLLAGESALVLFWASATSWGGQAVPMPRALWGAVGAVAMGEGMVALQLATDKAVAASLAPGSAAVLDIADRWRVVLPSLFEATLVPALWSSWSMMWARGDRKEVDADIRRWLTRTAWATPLAVVAGLGLRGPLLDVVLSRSALDPLQISRVSSTLGWLLLSLWPSLVATLTTRRLILFGRESWVAALGVGAFVVNLALDLGLAPRFGTNGIAAATVVTSTTACVVGWILGSRGPR